MRIFGRHREKNAHLPHKRRLLFVSHEATRTGAPQIILNLLKHFRSTCDVACESILLNGGQLATAFSEHSMVDCFNLPPEPSEELTYRVKQVVLRERNNSPLLAICNSMESRFIAAELHRMGVPSVALIHELPSSYTEHDYRILFEVAEQIVFPCHAVSDRTNEKVSIPDGKTQVIPQGLLNPNFGSGIDRKKARQQIRSELGLPHNAAIVLGCGTLDLRKGCDHFVNVARQVLKNHRSTVPVHFVWIGGGPRWTHSLQHYLDLDLQKSSVQNFVHFIGERADVEPYFCGANAFLLTSRVDPFPCVVHEAMAAELPIIAFENSGGVGEAISNGAGLMVPYADYEQASHVLHLLIHHPSVGQSISAKALDRVHTRYRFEDYATKIVGLGESVIGQKLRYETATLPFRRAA
jgi:glycosyltransferase involved in cell wall biosynthesis